MYSIVYVSTAQPDLEARVVKNIFDKFRINNDVHNIRGILMYSDGNFFQVLETEIKSKQVIIDLYQKIQMDGRHYDVTKIIEKGTKAQCFTKYHTAFKTMFNSADVKELYKFLKQEKQYNPEGYSKIAYLTQKFLALI